MPLRLHNTLTRRVEEFKPRETGKVSMYTCGPTVYNRAHIGNFRTFLFSDFVRRYFKYAGYGVKYVMNITDIDDRTITGSQKENIPMKEFTERYTKIFLEDCKALGIEPADILPKATDHIPEMVDIVKKLSAKGLAYESDGSWYYKVSSFPTYGELAKLDAEGLRQVERVAGDDYQKRDPRDFALWKAWEPSDGDVYWETELGKGRPGWHLECSAMSLKYLGEDFDLHLGGVDLIFPHHQNEIAQTEGATGHRLCKCWVHAEFLMIDSDKMSKSLGNFHSIADVMEKGWSAREIRFALSSAHYRQQLNFTIALLEQARGGLERIDACLRNLEYATGSGGEAEVQKVVDARVNEFNEALADDLNNMEAVAAIYNLVRELNSLIAAGKVGDAERRIAQSAFNKFDQVLGYIYPIGGKLKDSGDQDFEQLVRDRDKARAEKNWPEADRLKKVLAEKGIVLEDRAGGTVWRRSQEGS